MSMGIMNFGKLNFQMLERGSPSNMARTVGAQG